MYKGRETRFNRLDGLSAFSAEHGHDEIRRDTASATVVGVGAARGIIGVDVEGECNDCVSVSMLVCRLYKIWVGLACATALLLGG
jgi:hypothetical protein